MSEIKGKIKTLGEEKIFGNNGFRKRELVVTTEEQYPQHILVEFVQDKCDLVKNLLVGQEVTVYYNLRGREWVNPQGEAKYFNTIQGWKVEAGTVHTKVDVPKTETQKEPEPILEEDHDDLPF